MPTWSDDEGRYWYKDHQIPHAPVVVEKGCHCKYCQDKAGRRPPLTQVEVFQASKLVHLVREQLPGGTLRELADGMEMDWEEFETLCRRCSEIYYDDEEE